MTYDPPYWINEPVWPVPKTIKMLDEVSKERGYVIIRKPIFSSDSLLLYDVLKISFYRISVIRVDRYLRKTIHDYKIFIAYHPVEQCLYRSKWKLMVSKYEHNG